MKGLQRWMISRAPSESEATMPVGGWIIFCRGMYVLSSTPSGSLFLLDLVSAGLGGSTRAAATPDGVLSQILVTLEGPSTGIPSPEVHRPH